jgi:uncharacterized protein (TIGR02246 family)
MSAHTPEEIHRLFSTAFNAGDLDALIALYEPEATLIPQPGEVTRGRNAIRQVLQQFLALKGTMQLQSLYAVNGPGVALLSSRWKLTGIGPDGKPIEMSGKGVEVARRQPAGDWLLAIDHPFGAD